MLQLKKLAIIAMVLFLNSACSWQSGKLQLMSFNQLWDTGSPDTITVKKGDTLYSLSRTYNIPIRDIIEANRLTPPYTLYVGRVLRLPIARYHTVALGDTLYSISKHYNVDITTLSKLNNLREPYTLSIGQKLALPASISSTNYSESGVHTTPVTPPATKTSFFSKSAPVIKKAEPVTSSSKAKPTAYRKNKFAWPVRGTIISRYGAIGKGRSNDGINIKAPLGTVVKAADSGKVAYAGNELKGFGNLILIQHNDGWITAYAHNSSFLVKKGQWVQKGSPIAKVGSSGGVNTPQLHFEVRSGKKPLNPLAYLP